MGILFGRAGKALHDGRLSKILDARFHRIGMTFQIWMPLVALIFIIWVGVKASKP
jgi:hypothetical protein